VLLLLLLLPGLEGTWAACNLVPALRDVTGRAKPVLDRPSRHRIHTSARITHRAPTVDS
jgi:hypothetical protein